MSAWQAHPIVYEINTLVWLNTLSQRYNRPITLANIPDAEIAELASYQIQAVWLMGIWHRGEKCRASALNYVHEYRVVLPDVTKDDVVGSAYAIGGYTLDASMGGKDGLQAFRQQLAQHNIKIILDWVPNHVGLDHPWLTEHPEYFIQGTPELLKADPGNFFSVKAKDGTKVVIAHGRDPYFPGWIDTAQLNIFHEGLRQAVINTLVEMATLCDGIRCDMAMLMINDVFHQTWGWRGIEPLPQSYWTQVIENVRHTNRDFLFIAEVYWGLEYALHLEGFDYTYDKTLYDRALEGNVDGIYSHLSASQAFLKKNIRFIENHDEPRAASSFGTDCSRPVATLICTLPGAVLLHDGQFVGRRAKLPVQITRQPHETEYTSLYRFYMALLNEASDDIYRDGQWTLFHRSACHGCFGHQNIIAYGWQLRDDYRLIILNLSGVWSQATLDLSPWDGLINDYSITATNVLTRTTTQFSDEDLVGSSLQVELDPYHIKIYHLNLTKKRKRQLFGVRV
jgi:hypothetical protein